jgi:hypothetical protein
MRGSVAAGLWMFIRKPGPQSHQMGLRRIQLPQLHQMDVRLIQLRQHGRWAHSTDTATPWRRLAGMLLAPGRSLYGKATAG